MKERELWIDYMKGIAILLVVLGHAIRPSMRHDYVALDIIFGVIYSIHMPLFFAVSGFLLTKSIHRVKSFSEFLKKKTILYMGPFISYSLIIYILFKSFFYFCKSSMVSEENLATLSNYMIFMLKIFRGENPFLIHLWFLPAIFLMVICTTCLYFIAKDKYKWVSLGLALFIWVLRAVFEITPIHMFNIIMWDYIFFVLGLSFDSILALFNEKKRNIITVLFSLTIVLVYTCLVEYVKLPLVLIIFLRLAKSVSVLLLCCGIAGMCKQVRRKSVINWFGKNSMSIYLLHQPFCCAFLGTLLYDKLDLPFIIVIIMEMVMSVIAVLFVISVITKNNLVKSVLNKLFAIRYEEL